MNYYNTPPGKDPQLWQLAYKRASFKRHVATYITVNIFLWVVWYLTDGRTHGGIPWPAWSTAGWGLGLFFHFIGAYVSTGEGSVDSEYEKLVQNKNKQ